MEVTINDFKVANFNTFLEKANIGEHHHGIVITPEKTYVRATNSSKSMVKYSAIKTSMVASSIDFVESPIIKIPLLALKKVIAALNVYKAKKIESLTVSMEGEKFDDELIVREIKFKHRSAKVTVPCVEPTLVQFLTDQNWSKFVDDNNSIIKVDFKDTDKKALGSLLDMVIANTSDKAKQVMLASSPEALSLSDPKGKYFSYNLEENVEQVDTKEIGLAFSDRVLALLDAPLYRMEVKLFSKDLGAVIFHENEGNVVAAPISRVAD